jgi:transposase
MFSYLTLEQRVPQDHPLREIRTLTDGVLQWLDPEFDKLYAATGRASIAPEYVLRALLLQAFYSIRSELQLVEQIDYNLLFRWFVGLGMDDAVWRRNTGQQQAPATPDYSKDFTVAYFDYFNGQAEDSHQTASIKESVT